MTTFNKYLGKNSQSSRTELGTGWRMISSDDVSEDEQSISQASYDPSNWYTISKLPATVLAVLEENGVYPDLFYGRNLQKVPDLWKQDWWYRTEFLAPAGQDQYWLNFRGISYRADIFLNGVQIASRTEVLGAYRHFRFNVTGQINAGGKNALALKIYPENTDTELAMGTFWQDWINVDIELGEPEFGKTKDHNAGIWQRVYLETSGDVQIRYPLANTDLSLQPGISADITVYADLVNGSPNPVSGTLSGIISRINKPDITFQQHVTLAGRESKEISFSPDVFSHLKELPGGDIQ